MRIGKIQKNEEIIQHRLPMNATKSTVAPSAQREVERGFEERFGASCQGSWAPDLLKGPLRSDQLWQRTALQRQMLRKGTTSYV